MKTTLYLLAIYFLISLYNPSVAVFLELYNDTNQNMRVSQFKNSALLYYESNQDKESVKATTCEIPIHLRCQKNTVMKHQYCIIQSKGSCLFEIHFDEHSHKISNNQIPLHDIKQFIHIECKIDDKNISTRIYNQSYPNDFTSPSNCSNIPAKKIYYSEILNNK